MSNTDSRFRFVGTPRFIPEKKAKFANFIVDKLAERRYMISPYDVYALSLMNKKLKFTFRKPENFKKEDLDAWDAYIKEFGYLKEVKMTEE